MWFYMSCYIIKQSYRIIYCQMFVPQIFENWILLLDFRFSQEYVIYFALNWKVADETDTKNISRLRAINPMSQFSISWIRSEMRQNHGILDKVLSLEKPLLHAMWVGFWFRSCFQQILIPCQLLAAALALIISEPKYGFMTFIS